MRNTIAAAVAATLLSVSGFSHAQSAPPATKTYAISPQPISLALKAFAAQSDLQLIYTESDVGTTTTQGVKGELAPNDALAAILKGTNLEYEITATNVVVIRKIAANPQTTSRASDRADFDGLEEIVVTATKRAQSVQDVPISIATVTAQDIDRRGLVSAEDYLRGIPGVSYTSASLDGSSIIIRGMETSPTAQNFSSGTTVATYFGEAPTTNSGGLSGGSNVDIKLVDIERVEVLRGPQGTSFGNSSLGGAVRTIPVAPKLEGFEGKVGAGYSVTDGTGSDNHLIQGVLNVPLIEGKLAVRGVAYQFADSGYYRNVAGSNAASRAAAEGYGAEAFAVDSTVGDSEFNGGRIAALFQATDALKITFSYLTQKTELDGVPLANSGHYEQALLEVAPGQVERGQRAGLSDTELDIANVVMDYDLGWGSLLATYSYVKGGSTYIVPFSYLPSSLGEPMSISGTSTHREHSGEIRLVTDLDGAWDFIVGLYAERLEDEGHWNYYWHGDPATNIYVAGETYMGDYFDQRDLSQRAAFAEVSWEFLENFTLTGGARTYRYDRDIKVDQVGPLFGDEHFVNQADASGSTFRANLSYDLTEDAMLYATWSEGFRLGKPQPGLPRGLCDVNNDGLVDGTNTTLASTRSTASDTVENMELGGKFTLFDRRLILNGDVYRIDWSDMPFRVTPQACDLAYNANAGSARSEGVELQANIYIAKAIRLDAGGSYTHARLTADAPGVGGQAGDRLPGSPRVSANLGLQYEFSLGRYDAFVRGDAIYVGPFNTEIVRSEQNEAGDYVQVDASARLAIDAFNIDLFVRNLTNEDAFVNRLGTFGDFTGYLMRPRTVGLQLSYNF